MSELLNLFQVLNTFFDRNLTWEEVDAIYTNEVETRSSESDGQPQAKRKSMHSSILELPIVQRQHDALSALKDLSTYIRTMRTESQDSYDNTYDSWDRVSEIAPRDAYLAFIYALVSLTVLDPKSADKAKLSLAAVDAYFLSLTIPGAKGYAVFEEPVIEHCLKVYGTLEHIQTMNSSQSSSLWMSFVTLSDDLKLLFRLVHFNDHIELRNSILRRLTDILYMNYKHGYTNANAVHIHTKCFEILDEAINAHNGEVQDTLMLLMNRTVLMHTYPDRPKGYGGNKGSEDCEHISEWFIKSIPKYPERLSHVLNFYIEWLVTNPLKSWKTEQTQRAMEFAAKYDAAIFSKCNKSCAEFLCKALCAEESSIRVRSIELIGRILQVESHVDWQMFRHEVSTIPREVFLIKGLVESLKDCNNNARLRAAQALQTVLIRGSPTARKILTEGIQFAQFNDSNVVLPDEPIVSKNELRYIKPNAMPAAYTFEGHGLIELAFLDMPDCLYTRFFRSNISSLRRGGIMLMEQVIKVNPLAIYSTNFVKEAMLLATDPVSMVRKQAMNSVDALLQCYPNCFAIICVWCRIWSCLMSDGDIKNIELAMECFRNRVLLNMKGIEHSNKPEHFMPWVIIRVLLNTQPRQYLQTCIQKSMQERFINQSVLSIIESHLLASTSSEAWAVLNFISGKIRSREPDALITHFTTQQKWNAEINMGICLEVLINCLPHFSHAALNVGFEYVLKSIREGRVLLSLISKAMDFLVAIDKHSRGTSKQRQIAGDNDENAWLVSLHNELVESINSGIANFPDNRYTFQGLLGAYSEVITMLPVRANRGIVTFIQKYMTECTKLSEQEYDTENERIFNWMIVIGTRLSLRDYEDTCNTCRIYKNILRNNDRPQIVNTIIVSLSDLGKRHTQVVEDMFPHLLRKLSSPYACNRIATFQCFEIMVMQDQIKLRGTILLSLLAVIVDNSFKVAQLANVFFNNYISSKNATLFQKCLAECPFVLNEYKNFVGMDSFQGGGLKSPLRGDSKRLSRRLLYNHFMATMDEINLVAHFEQLKFISEKSKVDSMLKTADGIAVVQDILFILRRICYITKQQKATAGDNKDDDNKDDENNEIDEVPPAAATTQDGKSTEPVAGGGGTGRGRGRKQQKLTMPDALRIFERSLVYIHTIYANMQDAMTDSLQKSFDKLCRALSKRFASYVDYAQPASFWDKYRKSKIANTHKKSTKRNNISNNDDDGDHETDDSEASVDDSDSDNELPLLRHSISMQNLRQARSSCDELLTEYVFNPHMT